MTEFSAKFYINCGESSLLPQIWHDMRHNSENDAKKDLCLGFIRLTNDERFTFEVAERK